MHKGKKGKGQKRNKRPFTMKFEFIKAVQLSPSRKGYTPFCAYYGPNGETCSETDDLQTVLRIPGKPPVEFRACPRHYEDVSKKVQAFLTLLSQPP